MVPPNEVRLQNSPTVAVNTGCILYDVIMSQELDAFFIRLRRSLLAIVLLVVVVLLVQGIKRNNNAEGKLEIVERGHELVKRFMDHKLSIQQAKNRNKMLAKKIIGEKSLIAVELQGLHTSLGTSLSVIKKIISLSEESVASLEKEIREDPQEKTEDVVYRMLDEEKSLDRELKANLKLWKFLKHGRRAVETLRLELLLVEDEFIHRQQNYTRV